MDDGAAVLLVLGLFSVLSLAHGLRCYKCNSGDDARCQDPFTGNSNSSSPDSMDTVTCDWTGITHLFRIPLSCAKKVYSGGVVTQRGCTLTTNDTCENAQIVVNGEDTLKFCGVCDEDGCNFGDPVGPSLGVLGTLPLVVVIASSRGLV